MRIGGQAKRLELGNPFKFIFLIYIYFFKVSNGNTFREVFKHYFVCGDSLITFIILCGAMRCVLEGLSWLIFRNQDLLPFGAIRRDTDRWSV